MSTTPKANVKRRYPAAYSAKIGAILWVIMPVKELGRTCLGTGKTAMHAWKAAAKAIAVPREK